MRKFILLALAALTCTISGAQILPLGLGRHFGAQPNPNPLTLNRLLASQLGSVFTFKGSWKVPNNVTFGAGAVTVSGSTLYLAVNGANQQDTAYFTNGSGIAAISIPTLSGTPQYDGSNAGAPCNSLPCATGSGTVYVGTPDATVVAPAPYTITGTPASGATSATFTAAPVGFGSGSAGIPNWFVKFTNGVKTQEVLVTSWNAGTKVFGWSGGLTQANFSTTVSAYQWNPTYPYGWASGDRMTGSLLLGGNLLLAGAAYYDASCTANLGWVLTATAASPAGTFGAVNTVSGYPSQFSPNTPQAFSRHYAGALGSVPAIWQSLLKGSAYIANGLGTSSNVGCYVPFGYNFATFDPTTVTGGAVVAVHPILDYMYHGSLTGGTAGADFTAAWPTQLTGRVLAGPLPLCVAAATCSGGESTYYPATITGGNGTGPNGLTGATAATLVLPVGNTVVTANTVAGSNNLCITAIQSGPALANNGTYYHPTGGGIPLAASNNIDPAYDQGPGHATGVAGSCGAGLQGNYQMGNAALSTNPGETVTLAPQGLADRYYWFTFSDGETRIAHVAQGNTAFPVKIAGTNDPTTFAVVKDDSGATMTAPLHCDAGCTLTASQPLACVSCTTAITLSPLSDALTLESEYPLGTAFIEPNSRTLVDISIAEGGIPRARADVCSSGGSGTDEPPLFPDPNYYVRLQVALFDLKDALAAPNVYQTSPYAVAPFPGESAFHSTTLGPNCLTAKQSGFMYFDPATSTLYAIFQVNQYTSGGAMIVDEWNVAPIADLIAPRLRVGAAANDEHYQVAA